MTAVALVLELIGAIETHLQTRGSGKAGVEEVLSRLKQTPLTSDSAVYREPRHPALSDSLDTAIRNIPRSQFGPIAEAIDRAKHQLHWRVDRGLYYGKGEDVGAGYAEGNMHCNLIGPDAGVFPADDFQMGLFFLAPRLLYRDHDHPAPEFYFTLTGPSGWRFEKGPWQDHPPGAMIWNSSNKVHAMRVYDVSFLAVYAWTRDVHAKCRVIPADDWTEIEDGLRTA